MIKRWLTEKTNGVSRFQRLVELIAVNYGSIDITQIGPVANGSVWGRAGLTGTEALELTGLVQFLFGMCYITGAASVLTEIQEQIQREIMRREQGLKLIVPTGSEVTQFGR